MKIEPRKPKANSRYNTGKEELKIIDFQEKQDETLWEKVERHLKWGLTARDKKGHSTEFRFRMRPVTRDMVGEIQSNMPDGFYKTQSHLYRAIFSIGCIVALHHIRKKGKKDLKKIEAIFDFMNMVAREERVEDIKRDAAKLKMEVMENGHSSSEEMVRKFKKLDKLLKELEKTT